MSLADLPSDPAAARVAATVAYRTARMGKQPGGPLLGKLVRDQLVELLRKASPAMTIADIAKTLKVHPRTVTRHLDALRKSRKLRLVEEPIPGERGSPRLAFSITDRK